MSNTVFRANMRDGKPIAGGSADIVVKEVVCTTPSAEKTFNKHGSGTFANTMGFGAEGTAGTVVLDNDIDLNNAQGNSNYNELSVSVWDGDAFVDARFAGMVTNAPDSTGTVTVELSPVGKLEKGTRVKILDGSEAPAAAAAAFDLARFDVSYDEEIFSNAKLLVQGDAMYLVYSVINHHPTIAILR